MCGAIISWPAESSLNGHNGTIEHYLNYVFNQANYLYILSSHDPIITH